VQLERLTPERPGDAASVHLLIGSGAAEDYDDELALYPEIRFSRCSGVSAWLGNSIAGVSFEHCSVNVLTAPGLRGDLSFASCRFQPDLQEVDADIYAVESALDTRSTNCTVHAPIVGGEFRPELVDRTDFVEMNGAVRTTMSTRRWGTEFSTTAATRASCLPPTSSRSCDCTTRRRSRRSSPLPGTGGPDTAP